MVATGLISHYTVSGKRMEPIVLVHGGAGDIVDSRVPGKIAGVKLAATRGYQKLKDGGSVLDAVEAAVRSMEDDPVFNAGNIELAKRLQVAGAFSFFLQNFH